MTSQFVAPAPFPLRLEENGSSSPSYPINIVTHGPHVFYMQKKHGPTRISLLSHTRAAHICVVTCAYRPGNVIGPWVHHIWPTSQTTPIQGLSTIISYLIVPHESAVTPYINQAWWRFRSDACWVAIELYCAIAENHKYRYTTTCLLTIITIMNMLIAQSVKWK